MFDTFLMMVFICLTVCGRSVNNVYQGITFWVLVKVCNILSLVTSDTLCADFLANLSSTEDLSCTAIFVLQEGLHICIYLREHKRSIILTYNFSLLYGLHWNWTTAEYP